MSTFDALWDDTVAPAVADVDEPTLVRRAQSGDDDAMLTLARRYLPALRAAVRRGCEAGLTRDDARQTAMVAFLAAVRDADPSVGRLAGFLPTRLHREMVQAAGDANSVARVPARTATRFFSALRAAGGDLARAADLAPSFDLTRDAFWDVAAAVRVAAPMPTSDDDTSAAPVVATMSHREAREYATAEMRAMVARAFRAVNERETAVIRHAYGFEDYGEPQSDAEVGHRLGMNRLSVLRTRTRALQKMRVVLGA